MITLSDISRNIKERMKSPMPRECVGMLTKDFVENVITNSKNTVIARIVDGEFELSDFGSASILFSDTSKISLTKVCGIGDITEYSEGNIEQYEPEWHFTTEAGLLISLSATVKWAPHDGTEVQCWTLLVNGEDCQDLIVEGGAEEELNEFISGNTINDDYFNIEEKPLTDDEIMEIAKILKIVV